MPSASPPPPDRPPLAADDAEELRALTRAIRLADRFALLFARVNLPARRDALADRLREAVADAVDVLDVRLTEPVADLAALLARRLEEVPTERRRALFVYGLEHSLPSDADQPAPPGDRRYPALAVLNLKRELLKATVPVPVVLWVPEYALRAIARGAPDLWAWRSGVFDLSTPAEEVERTWETMRDGGSEDEFARLTPEERRDRIQTLTALLEDYDARPDAERPELLRIRFDLSDRLGRLYEWIADYDSALRYLEKAVNLAKRLGASETDQALNNLAHLLDSRGDLDSAERLYRSAVAECEKRLGPEHLDTLTSVNNLSHVLYERGDLDAAEPLLRRVLEGHEAVLGPEDPATLRSANNLAHLLQDRGDLDGAESLFRRALVGREHILGPEHPDTLNTLNSLSYLLYERGDLEAAEALLRRAIVGQETRLGPEHPSTLTYVNNLAYLLHSRGDLDGATLLYRRALEGRERVLGPEHPDTLGSVNNLAVLLDSRGDLDGAEPLYRRALEGLERKLGPEHPTTRIARENLEGLRATREALSG